MQKYNFKRTLQNKKRFFTFASTVHSSPIAQDKTFIALTPNRQQSNVKP